MLQTGLFTEQILECSRPTLKALEGWCQQRLGPPTAVQQAAWPIIREGRHALLLSATGQGKSLGGWLPLVERCLESGAVQGQLQALHIAPLKALACDMTHNLQPLMLAASAISRRKIVMEHRSGDTSGYERDRQLRKPPAFLATTPETLFILLSSQRGRRLLRTVRTVVIDELHAMAQSKRGAHLALSLERLDRLTRKPVQRIGLSATARPADTLADWLTGGRDCEIIQADSKKTSTVQIERLAAPLGPFPHHGHWQQVHERIAELAIALRPGAGMLVFCSTRGQVEQTSAALAERIGQSNIGAHHGSLDRKHREQIEQRFRAGELSVIVSSASLELGIDLGEIECVCQIGSIGSINRLCQRAGRSGHRPGARTIAHVFPLTLNQWLEAEAASDAIQQSEIEATVPIPAPLDVLAQQVLAVVVSSGALKADDVYQWVTQAYPWRNLCRDSFDEVIQALLLQPVNGVGDQSTLLSQTEGQRLQAHPHAARLVMSNAGTIPEWFQYDVVDAANQQLLGQLDEEFAFDSSVGDVIQLGNRPYQIVRTRPGTIQVLPYDGDAVQVPFWFGDGAGRSPELSARLLRRLESGQCSPMVRDWLKRIHNVFGALPARHRLLIERFRDPNNDRHIVLHTFAGARMNRAWGLALRKRFCRQFNFELQAAATDDGILISIGTESTFDVDAIVRFVTSKTARGVVIQALLDTPLFVTRFRWCANTALSVLRVDAQGPVSPQIQRNRTENLIEQVFPDQLACLENLSGPREVPDHPLVQQALNDCLHEHMDIEGLETYLEKIESARIKVIALDLDEPSPLAESLIHAPPHSFLDEEAAEERRTRSFESRPGSPFDARRMKQRSRHQSSVGSSHPIVLPSGTESLLALLDRVAYLRSDEGEAGIGQSGQVVQGGWTAAFQALMRRREAFAIRPDGGSSHSITLWTSRVHLAAFYRLMPEALIRPWMPGSLVSEQSMDFQACLRRLVRSRVKLWNEYDPVGLSRELHCSPAMIDEVAGRVVASSTL